MVVEKLLEQPHPPPSRVKRREKVLPGQLFSSATLKQTCLQAKADLIRLRTPFRRLLQSHDVSRRWYSGGILGLLPDRTGHNEEAALLNACRETVQNCAEHQDLVEHIIDLLKPFKNVVSLDYMRRSFLQNTALAIDY